jgi:hypothetical protein
MHDMPKELFNYHVQFLDVQNFTFVSVSDFFFSYSKQVEG